MRVQQHGNTIFRVIEFLPPGILSGFVIADQSPGIRVVGRSVLFGLRTSAT
jgi:hypothetical protein